MGDRSHHTQKIQIEEAFLASLNETIPELDYVGGLRTFGKNCQAKGKTVLVRDVSPYGTNEFESALDQFGCVGGLSPLGKAIAASGGDLSMGKPTAVIIITDGLDMDADDLKGLLQVDTEGWKAELPSIKEHFATFGDKLPKGLQEELDALEKRLG